MIKKTGTPAEMNPRLSEIKTMIRLNVIGGAELGTSSSSASSLTVLARIVPFSTVTSTLLEFDPLFSSIVSRPVSVTSSRFSLNRLCRLDMSFSG